MTFGARVWKTGIAVTLSLYISMLFQFKTPVIAAVAAIFAMQPSIYRSWRYFLDQFQTNTVGAIIALWAGMAFSNAPIAVGIVCVLVIMICLKMKMGDTVDLTLVTVITVMEASGQWDYALIRFFHILTGIGSAFLINIFLFPPDPRIQFIGQIQTVFTKMSLLLRTIISDEMKETAYRAEKDTLGEKMKWLTDKYSLFEEEAKKLKRVKQQSTCQLVVYQHLLNSLWKGMAVLQTIEEHYLQIFRTQESNQFLEHHLEMLIKCHEHVLLEFEDKAHPGSVDLKQLEAENEVFMQGVMQHCMQEWEKRLRISIVAASLYEYGFQIARLGRLVRHVDQADTQRLLNGEG